MPNINDVYQSESQYLKASDLQGRTVPVVISDYEIVEFDDNGKKINKVVLSFKGKEKKLVLNSTNAHRIAINMGSEEVSEWVDGNIEIYPTQVDFGGKMVDAIRVKEQAPADVGDAEF